MQDNPSPEEIAARLQSAECLLQFAWEQLGLEKQRELSDEQNKWIAIKDSIKDARAKSIEICHRADILSLCAHGQYYPGD